MFSPTPKWVILSSPFWRTLTHTLRFQDFMSFPGEGVLTQMPTRVAAGSLRTRHWEDPTNLHL